LSRGLFAPLTEAYPMDDLAAQRIPADYYRRQVAQARRLAGEATTPAVKQRLRDLAAGSSAWPKASMKSLPGNFRLPEESTDLAFGASDPKEGLRDVEQSHSRRDRPIARGL
jgi:hypothetical protein